MPTRANNPAAAPDALPGRLYVARALLSVAIAVSVVLAPVPAMASRLGTDRIGGSALGSSELEESVAPNIGAAAGLLVTPDGRALWSRRSTTQRAMASITKIMVALVVLDRSDLDEPVTISNAASRVPYAVGLQPGERLSLRQLLELALVASSNDAAYALAEHVGGNVPAFVALMNERATALGLTDTRFTNPHGLDAAGSSQLRRRHRFARARGDGRARVPAHRGTQEGHAPRLQEAARPQAQEHKRASRPLRGDSGREDRIHRRREVQLRRECRERRRRPDGSRTGRQEQPCPLQERLALVELGLPATSSGRPSPPRPRLSGRWPSRQNPARTIDARFAETTSAVIFDLDGPVTRTLSIPEQVNLPVFEGQPLGQAELTQGERLVASCPWSPHRTWRRLARRQASCPSPTTSTER